MEPLNDGGVVVSLFLMVVAIAYALFAAVAYYESATRTARGNRLLRLLSGAANIGNSVTHVLLVVYTLANSSNESKYWVEERRLGGIEGPVFLAVMNAAAGIASISLGAVKFPLIWNSFVIVAGVLIPIVWLRFVEEGLTSWPYTIIFIWFLIFALELTAFTGSVTHYALVSAANESKDE